jgi:hypothetical protein
MAQDITTQLPEGSPLAIVIKAIRKLPKKWKSF